MKVLITAGPTREYIDPVRFISNASSGKMGYLLAEIIHAAKNEVILISGQVNITPPRGIKPVYVTSTNQMYNMVMKHINSCDIFISAAAVCDYTAETKARNKLKKTGKNLKLNLIPAKDIIREAGNKLIKSKTRDKKLLIGFALETENLVKNAVNKLTAKSLDMIIANSHKSINNDMTKLVIITKSGIIYKTKKITKKEAAKAIWKKIKSCLRK